MARKKATLSEKEEAIGELWRQGILKWKLKGIQNDLYNKIKYSDKGSQSLFLCSRQCLAEDTLIKTPEGLIKIQNLKENDKVYGVNKDGSISLTNVVKVWDMGEQEVVDLTVHNKVFETCTRTHRWSTIDNYSKKIEDKSICDFNDRNKIQRKFIKNNNSYGIDEPHAYVLGALLGDGCSRQGLNIIYISSQDHLVPENISNILGIKFFKNSKKNYTWNLSHEGNVNKGVIRKKVECNYYDVWCKGRYAHEKIADLNIIKKWNRESQYKFLAGLLDTDGSIHNCKDGTLRFSISMQSKSIIEAVKYIIFNNFQYNCKISIDNRSKYKNGPCYYLSITNNLFVKNILKEISKYLVTDRKKWKDEYETQYVENNLVSSYVGVKVVNPRLMKTWDITVDNETSLYLTANGLVTHNTGKTFTSLIIAIETCLQNSKCIVKYLCPQLDQAQTLIRPQVQEILSDCPTDVIPSEEAIWKEQQKRYIFPNGSQLQIGGTDKDNSKKLRGGTATLAICDEAGFMDNLKKNIRSVILPTLRIKKGKLIIVSTASEDPNHEFMVDFVEPARADGSIVEYTIYDNPLFSEEDVQNTIKQYPTGLNDPDFKREYLNISELDQEKNVINNFTRELELKLVREVDRPKMFDCYVSSDIAFKDLTAVLFGYYDFLNARLVVLDELIMNGETLTSKSFAEEVRKKEFDLFVDNLNSDIKLSTYRRVMDNNLIFINDLHKLHGLTFIPTKKDKKEAQINNVKTMLAAEQIIIHPRCKHLIYHIKATKWNKDRTEFQRVNDSLNQTVRGGHGDCLDALIYMVRNIDKSRNPYPSGFFKDTSYNLFESLLKNPSTISKNLQEVANALLNKRKQ